MSKVTLNDKGDRLVLHGVKGYFVYANTPTGKYDPRESDNTSKTDFAYKGTFTMTQEHLDGLKEHGISLTYADDEGNQQNRFKPLSLKDKDTGERTLISDISMTFSRDAKSDTKKRILANSPEEAVNPIGVYLDGEKTDVIVGNGSTCDVEFIYRDKMKGKGKKLDILNINVTDLVEYESTYQPSVFAKAPSTIGETQSKIDGFKKSIGQ